MAKAKPQPADDSQDDYAAQADADTLTRAQEIQNDPDRHGKATEQLATRAKSTADAHKAARRKLHGKVKSGLKKAFGDNPAEQEGAREKKQMEDTVHTEE